MTLSHSRGHYLAGRWGLRVTTSDHTQPGLADKQALWVVIGLPARHARPAGGRALGPLGGPGEAAGLHLSPQQNLLPGLSQHLWVGAKGGRGS